MAEIDDENGDHVADRLRFDLSNRQTTTDIWTYRAAERLIRRLRKKGKNTRWKRTWLSKLLEKVKINKQKKTKKITKPSEQLDQLNS